MNAFGKRGGLTGGQRPNFGVAGPMKGGAAGRPAPEPFPVAEEPAVSLEPTDGLSLGAMDRLNNRIQQLDKDLDFKSAITSGLNRPTGVVIPPNSNLLFIVDRDNNRIVVLDLVK